MPDPRFFSVSEPKSLSALCDIAGATLAEGADPALMIKDVAALSLAADGDISFLDNVKYRDEFISTKAAACIIASDYKGDVPDGVALLYSDTPYKSFALISQNFYPDQNKADGTVHKTAIISDKAEIDPSVSIAAGVVIDDGAKIGAGTVLKENAVIGKSVEIGQGCLIEASTVISHSLIGDGVRIYPGCCIGQDGFGFAIDKAGFVKVPQLGRVIIGDGVQIGANTTIDRGAGPDTTIGHGTWIDNLVQIGHNVKIGNGCIIVSQVGISGSSVIEDYVVLAGQVGIAGHLTIGKGARIGAQAGIMRDVPAGEEHMGSPALPIRQFMRQTAYLNKAIKPKKKT